MQQFSRLESRDPEPWREKFTFVVSNLGGCKVGLVPRGMEGEETGEGRREE